MKKLLTSISLVLVMGTLAGCVNTPTQTAGVKDDRPLIMFEAVQARDVLILDGMEVGAADNYIAGKSALKIEPGTHNIQILRDGAVLLDERFYISKGASKSFTIHAGK